ncbi:MAG: tetratricopeptide repeat protein [Anaerolineae bacterium]|nr:tetratricopeptide repeat protein [Anaerolineae bacterium]
MSDDPSWALIGRDELLSRFDDLVSQFRNGGSGYVQIVGEAGCGQSAFLQACGLHAAQSGWEVLSGQCTEETMANPYGPFLTMLGLCFDRNGRLINDRSVHSIVDQISLDDIFDALEDIPGAKLVGFGIKVGISIFESRRGQQSSDELLNRNFEFILQVLEQIERRRRTPLLLLIDDLHLAGTTTFALLDYLLTRVENARLLIGATWQVDSIQGEAQWAHKLPPRLAQPDAVLHLTPLNGAQMRQLGREVSVQHLPESLLDTLVDLSRGLPKTLVDSLRLIDAVGIESGVEQVGTAQSALQPLLDRQLAHLSDLERALIECAALLVEPMPLETLTSPLLCAYLGASERALLATVIDLAERGALLVWEGPSRVRFASSFLRQSLRERTTSALVQRDHLRIAQAIEASGGDSQTAQLAAHYLAGKDWDKALHFAVQNAETLLRSAAYPEAVQSYEMALQTLAQVSDPQAYFEMKYDILRAMSLTAEQSGDWDEALARLEEALALSAGDDARQAEIYAGLGWLRFQRGEVKTALALLDKSAGLYHQLDDAQGQAQVDYYLGMIYSQQKEWQRSAMHFHRYLETSERVGFSEGRASAYVELGNLHRLQYGWAQAEASLQQGIELAQAESDYAVLAQGYHYLGLCYSGQGREEAIPTLHRALEIVRTRTKQPVQEARLQNTLAETLVRQNRWAEAEEAFHASARLKERLGDKAGLAITFGGLGRMYSRQWRFDQAAEYLQKDIDLLAEEFEANVAWIQQWTNLIGEVRRLQGALDLAEQRLDEALSLAERISDAGVRARSLGFVHMFRANLALDRGQVDLAAGECEQAQALLAGTWAEGELYRTLARLARLSGDLSAASEHLGRALTAAEHGEEIDRAQTLLEQACLHHDLGDEAAMRGAIEQVIALARRLQNIELQRRAQTLLA